MSELALDHKNSAVTRTDELRQMMRVRFAPPEWALFFEVYSTTGWRANRRTDAVAISLYPSRGLLVHGFEIKASRADWLRELKDTAKAEEVFQYCDHWWLVVADREIVRPNELPQPWGLIAPRGDQLAIVTQAPRLKPSQIDRPFMAALARRANEAATESIQERVDITTREIAAREERRVSQAREEGTRAYQQLTEKVAEFEKASGIQITKGWRGGKEIGEAVKTIMDGGMSEQARMARYALQSIERISADLRALVQALPGDGA
jgi:hypothetical protein